MIMHAQFSYTRYRNTESYRLTVVCHCGLLATGIGNCTSSVEGPSPGTESIFSTTHHLLEFIDNRSMFFFDNVD